ncbi:glutathione S-transferase 1-like [Triticum dicoccoides]|uniref:glutathione S-transferase 1-like n=1 Tax=Triticum dicoccoides TaxID=85692 RepID=UPI001891BD58|nr:glutathione S-transferase 1-like [Triticum dicoccoides]
MAAAVATAAELGATRVAFETDPELLADALDIQKADSSPYAAIIEDIKFQLKLWFSKWHVESRAISRYVLRKGASDLLREGSLAESATVDAWLDAESHNFDRAMSVITFQCFVVPMFMGETTDHKIVEENLEKLKVALGVYEERLSRSRYLAGDFISLADLSHCPMAHYLLASPCASVLDAYPRMKAWVDGMMDRPSVEKVMELMDAS